MFLSKARGLAGMTSPSHGAGVFLRPGTVKILSSNLSGPIFTLTSGHPAFEGFFAFFAVGAFAVFVGHGGRAFAVCAGYGCPEDGA